MEPQITYASAMEQISSHQEQGSVEGIRGVVGSVAAARQTGVLDSQQRQALYERSVRALGQIHRNYMQSRQIAIFGE